MDILTILSLASTGVSLVNSLLQSGQDAAPASSVLTKGIAVVKALIQAGQDATPAIKSLMAAFGGDKTTVTQDELDKTEAVLDALIDEFNVDIP